MHWPHHEVVQDRLQAIVGAEHEVHLVAQRTPVARLGGVGQAVRNGGAAVKINLMTSSLCFVAVVSGFACGTAPASTDGKVLGAEQVPAAIRVPSGVSLVARFHAVGAQVYTCSTSASGAPAWTLKAPDAKLFDAKAKDDQVGTHNEGPYWTSNDGSSVRGKKIAQADAPQADAIPWLLLQATAHGGDGVFSKVEYIQRVNTIQGKAPAFGCDAGNVGAEVRADYSADYYFYGGVK